MFYVVLVLRLRVQTRAGIGIFGSQVFITTDMTMCDSNEDFDAEVYNAPYIGGWNDVWDAIDTSTVEILTNGRVVTEAVPRTVVVSGMLACVLMPAHHRIFLCIQMAVN